MEKDDALSGLKDQLLLVPVVGTAIAITFDVGYFLGININFFTLFSISEHIVFALAALPTGVMFAGLIALGLSKSVIERRLAKPNLGISHRPVYIIIVVLVGIGVVWSFFAGWRIALSSLAFG